MLNFMNELGDFFLTLLHHLKDNIDQEVISSAVLGLVLIFVFLLQRRTRNILFEKVEKQRSYIYFLNDLVFPFLYLLIIKLARLILKGDFSLILFNSIAYFYIGFFIIRNLLRLLGIHYLWSLSYTLLLLFTGSLSIMHLNDSFFKSVQINNLFSLVFKVSLILLIYIFLPRGVKFIINLIPEKRYLSKRVLEYLIPFFSIIYLIVSILWVLKDIRFSSSFFTGVILSLIAIIAYGFLSTYFGTHIKLKIEAQKDKYPGLIENIRRFLVLILVFMLYKIFKLFFNLDVVVSRLGDSYIIKTDHLTISLFSVISAIYTFMVLFSFVGILKHKAYFYYIRRNKEIEAGSMRAMVSNLGFILIAYISLSLLGLTWKALLPVAGALGIGVGFGLQAIMNNYISGFILLFSKKLKVGDIVEVQGNAGNAIGDETETVYGRIVSIDILSTNIQTIDGIDILVPNSEFTSGKIVNYSLSDPYIRVRIPFGVSYNSDPNKVREILLNIAKEHHQILRNPEPAVWFYEMGESALIFVLLVWVNIRMLWRILPLRSEIYFKAWYELKEAGIEIPFPQRDVWFKNALKIELEKELIGGFEEDFKLGNTLKAELKKETDLSD